jgi:hypothetical protein
VVAALPALAVGTPSAAPTAAADPLDALVAHDWSFAATQLAAATQSIGSTSYPQYTTSSGSWLTTSAGEWTSGFFPGALWLMYQQTGDPTWQTRAQTWRRASRRRRTTRRPTTSASRS